MVVGIGPGDREQMTLRALKAIEEAQVVVAYKTYLHLIEDLLEGKEVVASGMTQEVDRARQALQVAREGRVVAVISSGDPGIYGMAGLILELLDDREIEVEIVPGITAATAAASVLGAPLSNDFAVISLSDLLTPWERIVERLTAAAAGDLVVVLYNPRSHSRVSQIEEARRILLQYRGPRTPVGIVHSAKRGAEERMLTTLEEMLSQPIDMLSTVIIGNSLTQLKDQWMVTPRGYRL
ncbi:MAG: precorrin-3B C(17)-methyltransferase [Bacillota bacterium]